MTTTDAGAVLAKLLAQPFQTNYPMPYPRATVRKIRGRWWVTLWVDVDELADARDKHIAWLHHLDAMDWAAQRVHHERLAAGQTVTNHRRPPR